MTNMRFMHLCLSNIRAHFFEQHCIFKINRLNIRVINEDNTTLTLH